jgi:hypothetical protein
MDSDATDQDEAIRAATASLVETQAQIRRLLSLEVETATDMDLIRTGFQIQMSADALNRLLTLRGYGPESRG